MAADECCTAVCCNQRVIPIRGVGDESLNPDLGGAVRALGYIMPSRCLTLEARDEVRGILYNTGDQRSCFNTRTVRGDCQLTLHYVYAKLLLTCGGVVPLSDPARSAVAENGDATSNGDS